MARDWKSDLLYGGAGALDEVLFGLPEWAAKKVNRKAAEDFIAKNPEAYHAGELAGTVGSLFIPMGGLASGVFKGAKTAHTAARGAQAAKLLKAADTVSDTAKFAKAGVDWSKIAKLAGKGALYGGAESGIRGITSESEDVAGDVARGLKFGAAGGAPIGSAPGGMPAIGSPPIGGIPPMSPPNA